MRTGFAEETGVVCEGAGVVVRHSENAAIAKSATTEIFMHHICQGFETTAMPVGR